jgi:hypothetical protein
LRLGLWILFMFCGCGDDAATTPDASNNTPDAAVTCQPQSAIGAFYRRSPNPRLVAGHSFSDGKLDTALADPNLSWDEPTQRWVLYYQSPHGTTFNPPGPQILRRVTSTDLASWTYDDSPSFTVSSSDWDSTHSETPSIVYNPDAPADRRYLLLYSGASRTFPNYAFPDYAIGAAFSADGATFTRVAAADSPHGKAGLVLTGADVYPGAGGAIVADPEVVLVAGTYHLWFSSFACTGTNCATVEKYGIAHATSTDGIHWTVQEAPVRSLLRASADLTTGGAQPSVIYDDIHCKWEMWLTSDATGDTATQPIVFNNMAGVWHATSTNATSWTINYQQARDLAWDAAASGEHLGLMTGADVAAKTTGRYMVYTGFDNQDVPTGSFLPDRSTLGYEAGVMTLNLATRDAP